MDEFSESLAAKTVVHFHIGRGGRFNNPGHKTFEAAEELTWNYRYVTVIDTDEDGNPLPDEEWRLIEDASEHVLLEGRDEIESPTGILDYDGDSDTDIFKYLEDCDWEEFEILQKAIEDGRDWGLSDGDIEYISERV